MTAHFTRRMSRVALLGAAAAVAVMLSACGDGLASGGDEQKDEGPIVLGMLTPLSGSSAAIGPYMKNGAQLAIDEINAKGGVNGRKLELKVEDDACDAKTAAAGANKLVTAGVVDLGRRLLLGRHAADAADLRQAPNIPMIIPAANSNELVDQQLKQRLPDQRHRHPAGRRGGEVHQEAGREQGRADGRQHQLLQGHRRRHQAKLGSPAAAGARWSRVGHRRGERLQRQRHHRAEVRSPDFIYWTGYYQEGGLIIRQLRQAGYKGTIMVADGIGRRRSWWRSPVPRTPRASSPP